MLDFRPSLARLPLDRVSFLGTCTARRLGWQKKITGPRRARLGLNPRRLYPYAASIPLDATLNGEDLSLQCSIFALRWLASRLIRFPFLAPMPRGTRTPPELVEKKCAVTASTRWPGAITFAVFVVYLCRIQSHNNNHIVFFTPRDDGQQFSKSKSRAETGSQVQFSHACLSRLT